MGPMETLKGELTMRITRHIRTLAVALAIAVGVSFQGPALGAGSTIDFVALDTNRDGRISPAEAQYIDDLRGDFAALDVNRDEFLTPTEYSHWGRAGKTRDAMPLDPSTGSSGSNGSQHMPK